MNEDRGEGTTLQALISSWLCMSFVLFHLSCVTMPILCFQLTQATTLSIYILILHITSMWGGYKGLLVRHLLDLVTAHTKTRMHIRAHLPLYAVKCVIQSDSDVPNHIQ